MKTFSVIFALSLVTSATAQAAPLADVVRERVESNLPAGLGVVDIALPASAATAPSARSNDVSVHWVVPPRAGIVPIIVSWHHGHGAGQATLAPLRRVLITTRALAAGARIDDGDLVASQRAVVDERAVGPADPRGLVISRDLTAGDMLRASDIAAPTKLARGSHIRVLVRRGGVTIAGEGVLDRPAAVGERAQVRVPGLSTLIVGRLQSDGTVVDQGELQ